MMINTLFKIKEVYKFDYKINQLLHFTFQITLVFYLITTLNAKAIEIRDSSFNSVVSQLTKKKFDTGQNPKEEITRAEKILFMDNHLSKINSSKRIDYDLKSSGKLSTNSIDTIQVFLEYKKKIISAKAKLKSGKNAPYLKLVKFPESNPIILYFLERDIVEMRRLTKGNEIYFRKRIRTALAEGPKIRKIEKIFKGKKITALAFSIKPYATDPLRNSAGRSKYKRYSQKKYTFVISEKVPGHIIEITTNIPSKNTKGFILKEILSLVDSKNIK